MSTFDSPTNPFGQYQAGQEGQISPLDNKNVFRYTRNAFNTAGQKSYDSPPNQDPDAFLQLYNTLPVTKGALERRWGLTFRANVPNTGVYISRLVEYSNPNEDRFLILGSNGSQVAYLLDENFNTIINPLFSYSVTNTPRFLSSRHAIYTTNGVDYFKHNANPGESQKRWGISAADSVLGGITNTYTDPLFPSVVTITGSTGNTWINPNNIKTSNNVRTQTIFLDPPDPKQQKITNSKNLDTSDYGFALTSEVKVVGIKVVLEGQADGGADISLQLLRQGAPVGTAKQLSIPADTTDSNFIAGSSTDLWNATWNPTNTNDSTFGVRIIANRLKGGPETDVLLDSISVQIFYKGALELGSLAGGSVTLIAGRKYTIVFKNSATGHYSDLSLFTTTTGPITGKKIPLTNLPVSNDSQVDRKTILATADGNNTSKLYELVTLTNATTSYTDDTPESTLLLRNVYQETDDQGMDHGVAENSPPPAGTIFCKHLGRIYILSGSTLYYSKNDDDLTTSTGLITGRYEEAWPGDFQMGISEQAELGTALFSDGNTLYIATERHVRRLVGDGPENYAKPEMHFPEVGVISPETLKLVYVEGQPVGTMWLTPDLKVMGSDFNTYANVGRDIQNVLNTINRTYIARAHAAYFGVGVYSFYVLAIPTGNSSRCDTVCLFDLNRRKWHVWVLKDPTADFAIDTFLFNITSTGQPRLLCTVHVGGLNNLNWVMELDPDATTDGFPNPIGTQNIPVTLQTSWLHFGDPLTRKDFNEIEVMTADPTIHMTLVGASNSAEFASPTVLLTSIAPQTSNWGETKFYIADTPTRDRFYRITWASSGTTRTVLDAWSAEIISEHKF